MTQQENAETSNHPRSRYDRCDPHYLRELREAAGMDLGVLARTACLSVAQVRALESEASGEVFYSDTIKRQAYKRLLMILGAEPPTVEVPESLRDAHQVAQAHLNTLDQIVAMSHQPPMNYTLADRGRDAAEWLVKQRQLVGALLLLASALALFVAYGPLHLVQEATQLSKAEPVKAVPVAEAVSVPASETPAAPVAAASAVAPMVPASVAVAAVAVVPAAAPAPASVVPASTSAKPAPSGCAYSSEELPPLAPFVARKDGGYVYVVSSANTEVCLVDGNKQATSIQLKAGEGRTVTGAAPWQVSGAQLKQVQIYFQGGRVSLPDDIQRLKLVEQPVTR
ncbi:MAG: helix-turn-helix domain-containing protein [Limnohabitans sp.]|nr:helix-turn-helix domain-containing protein [Limnohabitans sp.]